MPDEIETVNGKLIGLDQNTVILKTNEGDKTYEVTDEAMETLLHCILTNVTLKVANMVVVFQINDEPKTGAVSILDVNP